jgi:hypothetical protein
VFKIRNTITILLLILLVLVGGCKLNTAKLLHRDDEPRLIKVQICFANGDKLNGYIKNLGIEDNGKVYVGGSSLNYFYDKNGKVVGSYNYNTVNYIKILSE